RRGECGGAVEDRRALRRLGRFGLGQRQDSARRADAAGDDARQAAAHKQGGDEIAVAGGVARRGEGQFGRSRRRRRRVGEDQLNRLARRQRRGEIAVVRIGRRRVGAVVRLSGGGGRG